jgi:hypothetical protein
VGLRVGDRLIRSTGTWCSASSKPTTFWTARLCTTRTWTWW